MVDHTIRSVIAPRVDLVVESWREGMRKPDARIFELACRRLGVDPARAVFLDDIGANLKAAAAVGMRTLKVEKGDATGRAALGELERMVGVALRRARL